MMRNDISTYTIDRQIDAMNSGNFKLSEIVDKSYENKVQQLLEIVVKEREKFENLSDKDKLIDFMMDKRIPDSAQARNIGDERNFDEKKETRKNTKKIAEQLLEMTDGDFEKAMNLVNLMS